MNKLFKFSSTNSFETITQIYQWNIVCKEGFNHPPSCHPIRPWTPSYSHKSPPFKVWIYVDHSSIDRPYYQRSMERKLLFCFSSKEYQISTQSLELLCLWKCTLQNPIALQFNESFYEIFLFKILVNILWVLINLNIIFHKGLLKSERYLLKILKNYNNNRLLNYNYAKQII